MKLKQYFQQVLEARSDSMEGMIEGVLGRALKGLTGISVSKPVKRGEIQWGAEVYPTGYEFTVTYKPKRGGAEREKFILFKTEDGEWGWTTTDNNEWEIGPSFEEAMDGAVNAIKLARGFHLKEQSEFRAIVEAKVAAAATGSALEKMVTYLAKKLGGKFHKVPGVEKFHNSKGHGAGVRYVHDTDRMSLRFNWASQPGNVSQLTSIDVWLGNQRDPNFNLHTEGQSFVKFLPQLAKLLQKPKVGKFLAFPVTAEEAVTEALTEASKGDFTPEQALDAFFKKLKAGGSFTRSEFAGTFHNENVGVFDVIINNFAEDFDVKGKRISAKPETWKKADSLRQQILDSGDFIVVEKGGKGEEYEATAGEKDIAERVPFKETLDHLDGLVKGLVAGAFNALFVAGKGGTGKTQTVEDALAEAGLVDGIGYFKNTGTASAAGMYNLLWHNRKNILLFDDSDGALADQDARNIIKAATDTKKKRKLVWNKKSSFIFDPDSESAEDYEDDPDMAPKYFDFEGRIIFISNLPLNKLDPDGALRTRAFVINVDPTDEELYERMEEILHKIKLEDGLTLSKPQREEVFDVVKSSKRQGDVSLRKLVRALNLAASGAPNWKELVRLYA